MSNVTCQIDRRADAWSAWDPYFEAVGSHVRLDPPSASGIHDTPCSHFRLYPETVRTDIEDDNCMLVVLDLILPVIVSRHPTVVIHAFVQEMCASTEVQRDDDGSWLYAPKPDPTWKPGLVRVRLDPT